MPGPRSRDTTVASQGRRSIESGTRHLVVLGEDSMLTFALPMGGELLIGRDAECDVRLMHEKISRRHARLHVGEAIVVEDLGSTNGVAVAGRRLASGERATLPLGESLRVGPYAIIALAGASEARPSNEHGPSAEVIVPDPTLEGVSELVRRVARHPINVLIGGETGVGKEVLAQTLHTLSERVGDLVAINCAAIAGPLLESELFGHEQGAFTGATRAKPGLLEMAGAGTALLDEVGDLPLELQGKLLRALEARQIYRVGGVKPIDLALRLIAATHRRLPDEVAAGRFRQDLYFRLNGITLEIAPLRARRDRIPALATQFLDAAARSAGIATPRLTARALAALGAHDWPGNVRELKAVIERALLLAPDGQIDTKHLLLSPARARAPGPSDEDRARFLEVARHHGGNVSAMARALATSRSQVHRLAARFGVDLEALRKS